MAAIDWRDDSGGFTLEAVLEFLLVLIIVPPLITCAIQAVLALANIVVPWMALVLIVFIAAAAIVMVVAALPRRREGWESRSSDMPLLPPVDRPKALRGHTEDDALR